MHHTHYTHYTEYQRGHVTNVATQTIPIIHGESSEASIRPHDNHVAAPRTVYTSLIAKIEKFTIKVFSYSETHQKEPAFFLRKCAKRSEVIITPRYDPYILYPR